MTKLTTTLALLAGLAMASLSGCGGNDCISACEDCLPDGTDCDAACADYDQAEADEALENARNEADAAGCLSEFNAFYDCSSDSCNPTDDCTSQSTAYGECVAAGA